MPLANTLESDEATYSLDGTRPPRPPSTPLPDLQLTRLEHYVMLHELGRGGMGVVYAAYDEQLDRKVAIKLLRPGTRSQSRLIREAQALARLSHPNVVQVYEIGARDGVQFIVMEFVDGQTLQGWAQAQERSRAEVLQVFRAAGAGLAAAHAKGLIHRDFKPDNVMISQDGRVLVMDFGLARGDADDEARPDLGRSSSLDLALTQTGARLGTPAYMSPEQLRGLPTDAKTDQFSFCVSLWQALYGQRPFSGSTWEELLEVVGSTSFDMPSESDVPAWLRKLIERGLALDPQQRWPSMDALLEALSADPTRRRRWMLGLSGALALGLAGGGAVYLGQARAHAALVTACEVEGQAIAQDWNDDTRAQLAQGFASSGLFFAPDAWARAERRLDDYSAQWSELQTQTCLATRVEHSRDETSYARVAECLDERRAHLRELLEAWAEPDGSVVTMAVAAVAGLPQLTDCVDDEWLMLRVAPPADEATRAQAKAARGILAEVDTLLLTGRYEGAQASAQELLAQALALGWDPLEAEAQAALGHAQTSLGDHEAGRSSLEGAYFLAGRSGHDLLALDAATQLILVVGVRLAEYEEALAWARHATMLLERMKLQGSIRHAMVLDHLGSVQHAQGQHEVAIASYEEALVMREAALGEAAPAVGTSHNNVAVIQWEQGAYDEALASLERARAIHVVTLGAGHPDVHGDDINIGLVHFERKELDAAATALRRALAGYELSLGPEHTDVASSLINLALVLHEQGAHDEALAAARRALAIFEAKLGPEHPYVGISLHILGDVEAGRGELEAALGFYERALKLQEASFGPKHPRIKDTLLGIGRVELRLGRATPARDALERAHALQIEAPTHPMDLHEIEFELAQALASLAEGERARSLATAAREGFRSAGESHAERLAEVEAWLAQPAPPR